MDNQKLIKLNTLINKSYECFSFAEFLKLTILKLHELVMYDSGMFFCGISKDCSFFKPYVDGVVDTYYEKQNFPEMEEYLSRKENVYTGNEAYVYKALDFTHGVVQIIDEPRNDFLTSQENFHIACIRIVNKGKFLGEIYLHRSISRPDFDEEDMFILQLLQPHISTVFSIIHTVIAIKHLESDNQLMTRKGMCLLDRELNLVGGNVTGLEMLKIQTIFGSSILYHVKELCHDMQNNSKDTLIVTLNSETYKTAVGALCIDVYYRNGKMVDKNTQFLIVMELINPDYSISDYKFKFTKRESDIIDGIIQGKNNAQLARTLHLSENTIKTHIKSIYHKVGANNRTELTYILMLNK